jgi:hypothetical protein
VTYRKHLRRTQGALCSEPTPKNRSPEKLWADRNNWAEEWWVTGGRQSNETRDNNGGGGAVTCWVLRSSLSISATQLGAPEPLICPQQRHRHDVTTTTTTETTEREGRYKVPKRVVVPYFGGPRMSTRARKLSQPSNRDTTRDIFIRSNLLHATHDTTRLELLCVRKKRLVPTLAIVMFSTTEFMLPWKYCSVRRFISTHRPLRGSRTTVGEPSRNVSYQSTAVFQLLHERLKPTSVLIFTRPLHGTRTTNVFRPIYPNVLRPKPWR